LLTPRTATITCGGSLSIASWQLVACRLDRNLAQTCIRWLQDLEITLAPLVGCHQPCRASPAWARIRPAVGSSSLVFHTRRSRRPGSQASRQSLAWLLPLELFCSARSPASACRLHPLPRARLWLLASSCSCCRLRSAAGSASISYGPEDFRGGPACASAHRESSLAPSFPLPGAGLRWGIQDLALAHTRH